MYRAVCFSILGVLIALSTAGEQSGDGKFIPKGQFYYFYLNFQKGGFLSESKMTIKVNGDKLAFIGPEYHAKVMQFGGVNTTIINEWLKEGKNHIQITVAKNPKPVKDVQKDTCFFDVTIDLVKEGEMADTEKPSNLLFSLTKAIGPTDLKDSLVYDGYFSVKK